MLRRKNTRVRIAFCASGVPTRAAADAGCAPGPACRDVHIEIDGSNDHGVQCDCYPRLANGDLLTAICDLLLPLTTVLTPNSQEARQLANLEDLADCGRSLQAKGSEFVLITGSHEASELVHNQLFMPDGQIESFNWERLPNSYHGSGCTLASAIAALLAQDLDPFTAINEAQEFTWQSLLTAYKPGQGQHHPNRLFWVDE